MPYPSSLQKLLDNFRAETFRSKICEGRGIPNREHALNRVADSGSSVAVLAGETVPWYAIGNDGREGPSRAGVGNSPCSAWYESRSEMMLPGLKSNMHGQEQLLC